VSSSTTKVGLGRLERELQASALIAMVRRNQPAGDQVSMMQTSPGAAGMPAAIRGSASTNVSQLEELMRRKGVDEAWDALEDMQRQGLTTDRFTISRMLMKTVADSRGRWNPAKVYRSIALVENFIQMQPTEADEVLFNALLDTHSRMKDLPRLQVTMQQMKDLLFSLLMSRWASLSKPMVRLVISSAS